jgi:hypothetical protein
VTTIQLGWSNTQNIKENMSEHSKTPYELRWDILKEMINVTQSEWFAKKEIAERNAEKNGILLEYIGDFPLQDAVARAENVYINFICKK